MRFIQFASGEANYRVDVGWGLLSETAARAKRLAHLSEVATAVVFTDRHVAASHARVVLDSLRTEGFARVVEFVLEPGEPSKTIETVAAAYAFLAGCAFPRDGLVVAVGGGVVSDIAGFVAATWMRGVRWIVCPTTLEACVDAAFGGKTGVNLPGGKNLVGAFHDPSLVIADPACLQTLPRREFVAGMAESVKHALVSSEELLAWHEANLDAVLALDPARLEDLIEKNARVKLGIVSRDPNEQNGERFVLNFGHTLGHAIENGTGYSLRHGECVSLGMVLACRLASRLGLLDEQTVQRVVGLLDRIGLPTRLTDPPPFDAIQHVMSLDKKIRENSAQLVLLSAVGKPVVRRDIPIGRVADVYTTLCGGR